jgi:pimeloyl-ACP methyl ester carboxylesterase
MARNIYKSEEGESMVRSRIKELYSNLTYPAESLLLETGRFGQTHCLKLGNPAGPVLILLHGSSSNSMSWTGYEDNWIEEFSIYALDLPGQPGLSSTSRPPLAEMSDWLDITINALGLEKFHLAGMSLGSWVGISYSIKYGEKVLSLTIITSGGFVPVRGSFFLRILPFMFMGDWGARKIGDIVSGGISMDREAVEFGALVNRYYNPLLESIPLFTDEDLASLTMPIIYFGGDKDVLLDTKATAERIKDILPGAVVRILPGVGHVILDRGEDIREFIKSAEV